MTSNRDLPFKVGQEVEAQFNEAGYRGAWFRCEILEIKTTTAEPTLLLKYLDFPDEDNSWTPVRQSFPSLKPEAWWKEKTSRWMVRPKPAIIHESEVEKYQEKIRMGLECSGYVHTYNHTHMIGDNVDWWVDDCYWSAKIIKIDTKTNKATLRFPPPPNGEGQTSTAPLESLRPSFSWTPKSQWRQVGLKKSEPRKSIQGYTSFKSSVQLLCLSGDSATPTVVSADLCGPLSSRNITSACESATDGVAVKYWSSPGEGLHKGSAYTRSIEEVVKQKHQLRDKNITSGATFSIEEVKSKKFRKTVLCNSSFTVSDSDEEDERSSTPRIHLVADGARSPKPDSEMGTERELVNPPTTHSVRLDASATSSPLVAISPTEGEMDSSAALAIAVKMTGELENIGSLVNTTPEHLSGGIAVGVNNAVATASEDLPQVKFVTPDAAVDDAVSTHFSPRNASDRNDESAGRCLVENADEADDPTAKVHHGGALSHFVPSGTQTSVGNPERGNDELEGDRNEVVVSAPTVADSEAAQRQCQNLEEIPMTTCTSRKEECLEVILVLDTGTQANDGDSELIGQEGCNQKLDSSVLGVSTTCSIDADLKHSEDAGLLSIVCTTPEDGHAGICDLHQQQGTGSPTEEASVSRSGQTKLLSHRSCVAIKKAINIGRSRKRRREKDHLVTNPKRVRQIEPKQRVALSGFQTDGSILPSSAPSTPTNNEKRMSVESIVKPEPVTSEPENRTVVIHDLIHEPLWVLALPRAREGKVAAMETPKLPTEPSDTEHRPAADESGLEDELDALERLTARVHVLGAQLQRHKMKKRKKVVWKISDENLFFSVDGEGASVDAEAIDVNDTSHSWDCSDFKYIPEWYLQSVFAKPLDGKDADTRPFPRDSNVKCARKSRSRRKFTKRGEKSRVGVRNRVKRSALNLKHPETGNQLLLGSGTISSKVECELKRKLADMMRPEEGCKKTRVDASTALVEAVQKTATPCGEVDLPRMRGSVQSLKKKLGGSKMPKASHKRDKLPDEIVGAKKMLSSVNLEQEQQLEAPHRGHIEQKSVGNSSLSELPTKSHLSSVSDHDMSSSGKLDSDALEGESSERRNWRQVTGNSDSEVLDIESENKVKLLPNGKFWCFKTHTVDGKLEWIGSFATKETALSVYYDILNGSSCVGVKEVSPLSHTSFSGPGEGAGGDNSSPERLLNEKQWKCSNPEGSNKCNASESSSTAVEPNAGSAVSTVEEANGMVADISRLDKNGMDDGKDKDARSGMDDEKDKDEDGGAVANVSKSVNVCEQESSVISSKEDASIGVRVEADSGCAMEGNIQLSQHTRGEETAYKLSAGPVASSCKSRVVNADRGIESGCTIQDKHRVKVEVSELQVVAAADNPRESWVHDAVRCQSGKDVLDRVSVNFLTSTQEIEAARRAKMALWRGVCCSSQGSGLVSQGLDLLKRIQVWQSRMHFQDAIDGDAIKTLLSTGKSSEEIYVGHYKTAKEVDAVRRILSRCKKEFAKSMDLFEASGTRQVTSAVIQVQASAEAVQTSAEAVQTSAEAVEASAEVVQANAEVVQASAEVVQASSEVALRQASAAPVANHLLSLSELEAHVNPRTGSIPPRSGSVQNVIFLDDDDNNEMVSTFPPSSRNARASTGTTSVGTINISIPPHSSRRENSFLSTPALRTHGQSNGVIPSFTCQTQERCHLTGGSPVVQSCVRQTVPISVQADNIGMDPFQSVGPGIDIYGRALTQPPRQGWSGSKNTSSTPFLAGNVFGQGQQVNQYGGTVGLNCIVNSTGRQVEIASSNPQSLQGSMSVPTSHVLENHRREVGGCSSLPTTFNSSTSAAVTANMGRRFYNCCPGIGHCNDDFMLFKALLCTVCNQLMHTQCAMAAGQLRLRRSRTGQELACYECACGRFWGIVPSILSRMKEFVKEIWRLQAERLTRDPHLTRPVRVIDLHKGKELFVIMAVLHKILLGAKTEPMLNILRDVAEMGRAIFKDANGVNYVEWIRLISNALEGSGHAN